MGYMRDYAGIVGLGAHGLGHPTPRHEKTPLVVTCLHPNLQTRSWTDVSLGFGPTFDLDTNWWRSRCSHPIDCRTGRWSPPLPPTQSTHRSVFS